MKAQNKQDFIKNWESYAREFELLAHSAESIDTFNAIRAQIKAMKEIVNKVAEECYGAGNNEKA